MFKTYLAKVDHAGCLADELWSVVKLGLHGEEDVLESRSDANLRRLSLAHMK